MRAIRLNERGQDGVRLAEILASTAGAGDARVRMLAASVNRVDLYMRDSGAGITHTLPQTMGVDGVGEVIEAPAGSGLAIGDRVILCPYALCGRCRYCRAGNQPLCLETRNFGEHCDGTFADEIVVPAASLVRLWPDVDIHAATCLGVAYLTAWRMVFGPAPAGPRQTVLIQGASGGVSYAAMQLARMAGARVLVTTTGRAKLDLFQSLYIEAIDYKNEDVADAVLALTDKQGADLVIDNVGKMTWKTSLRALARGGHLVTCDATTGAHPSADLQRLFIRQFSIHGTTMGSLEEFRCLVHTFEQNLFEPNIDSVFPHEDVPRAFGQLEDPDRLGKTAIDHLPGR